MTKMNRRVSAALVIASLSIATVAQATLIWSNSVQITKINVEESSTGPDTYMKFNAPPMNHGCSITTGSWIVGGNVENIKVVTQLALAAKLSGQNVKVLFNDSHNGFESCTGGGTTGYPKLRGIELQ